MSEYKDGRGDYYLAEGKHEEKAAMMPTSPRYDRELFLRIAGHLQKVAYEMGYMHPEHLSGHDHPAIEIPCLPETVAEQVVEKYLIEANAWQRGALERLRSDVHAYMEQANVYGGGLKIDRDDFDTILDDALVELDRLAASGEGTE